MIYPFPSNPFATTRARVLAGVAAVLAVAAVVAVIILTPPRFAADNVPKLAHPFEIQSVDVMKYSRDIAREKLGDPSFDAVIDSQVKAAKEMGATHVAVGTPYDAEFLPFLKRWVAAARRYGLNVWFRGNFSGWEEWFDYPRLSRADHVLMVDHFIRSNPDLFRDGDIFTPCPECENGGPGDPRMNGDAAGHRAFLEDEYEVSNNAFIAIGKDVSAGYFSMNSDVARLIMDKQTIAALGGIVSIDHYVRNVDDMDSAIKHFAGLGARVVIGEFGAPIPDLNGNLTLSGQADFVGKLLHVFYANSASIKGINYWVVQGGSTAILNDNGTRRPVFDTVKQYYGAPRILGAVTDPRGLPLEGAAVALEKSGYSAVTDRGGTYEVFAPVLPDTLHISRDGFSSTTVALGPTDASSSPVTILTPAHPSFVYKLQSLLYALRQKLHL